MEFSSMDEYVRRFEAYVASYGQGESLVDENIELKRVHCLLVCQEATAIAGSLGLDPRLHRLASVAGLYHDLGRFPQYKRFKTFDDSRSANHARLGVATIRREGLLGDLDRWDRSLVLGAITLHNRFRLPRLLGPELALLTSVVRDADKVDILRVMLDHVRPGGSRNDVVTLHLADEPDRLTPVILEQVRGRAMAEYRRMVFVNDFKLLLLSWVYDLNHAHSLRAVMERGLVDELLTLLPETEATSALGGQIRADAAQAMEQGTSIKGLWAAGGGLGGGA